MQISYTNFNEGSRSQGSRYHPSYLLVKYFSKALEGTYTLGVRRTPNHSDSDVTFSRSCDRGKTTKKGLKETIMYV